MAKLKQVYSLSKTSYLLLLPGWDASPLHGSGYLSLNEIDLSCS